MLTTQPFRLLREQAIFRPFAFDIAQALRQAPRRTFQTIQGPPSRTGLARPPRRPQCPPSRSRVPRRLESTKPAPRQSPDPTPHLGSPPHTSPPSMSQRLRKMSREYGWTALGVYLALSALDFPFCLLAVRMLGTDRIGRWEHDIINGFWRAVSTVFPGGEPKVREFFAGVGSAVTGAMQAVGLVKHQENVKEAVETMPLGGSDGAVGDKEWSWGVEEAQKDNKENATWATQLALAYAIHKSFIFIRVPLTAAVLPRVVKTLRGWGWDIGKRPRKTPKVG